MQFWVKIAILSLILSLSLISRASRFEIVNKVKSGPRVTDELSIFDENYNAPHFFLVGIDSNTSSIFDVKKEWSKILVNSRCSDEQFEKSFDYIQYLYFLSRVTINYEVLLDYKNNAKNINYPMCSIDFNRIIKQCSPRTTDMKMFLKRFNYSLNYSDAGISNEYSVMNQLPTRRHLIKVRSNEIDSPLLQTMKATYSQNPFSIRGEKIKKIIFEKCEERKSQLISACSENETEIRNLVTKEMTNLIKRSSAIGFIKKFGASEFCVDRFEKTYLKKIAKDDVMVRTVMRNIVNLDIPYLLGRYFVVGSLKIYDDLGVGEELFQEIKIANNEIVLPRIKEIKKIIKKNKKISKRVLRKVIQDTKNIPMKKLPKRKSALHIAALEMEKTNFSKVALDMDHFKNDYVFSNQTLIRLQRPLQKFQKRKSLIEMRDFDGLGEAEAPMRLLFVKYLIDNNYHQGLYNLEAVLADKFLVKNDLDKKDTNLYRMSIENSEQTNYIWQLFLHKK